MRQPLGTQRRKGHALFLISLRFSGQDEDLDLRRGQVIGLEGAQQISNPTHLTLELACLTRLCALLGSDGLSSSPGHLPVKASFFKQQGRVTLLPQGHPGTRAA